MIYRDRLIAWIVSIGLISAGPPALGQSSRESSVADASPPAFSVRGEQIVSWPADPWMTAQREREIFAALQKEWRQPPILEEPLSLVIRIVQEAAGDIPFRIDERALEVIGLTAGIPVTFDQQEISLGAALHGILGEVDLTFQITGGEVIITTDEAAEASLVTRVYDVTPLVTSTGDRMRQTAPDWYRLSELIQTTVSPDTWEMLGGPSSLAGRVVGERTLLITPTTTEVHFQIDALLNRLNNAGFASPTSGHRTSRARLQRSGSQTSEFGRVPASNPRLPRFGE